MRTDVLRLVFAAAGVAALTGSLAMLPTPSMADAQIITDNAFIQAGSGGSVTIDACAPIVPVPDLPDLGTMPSQGTFSSSLPSLPSIGGGSMGAFSTDTNESLPGGTYEYTSYEIQNGATVTYTGAVTIRVAGDATIAGRIETFSSGESVTLIAGGKIEFPSLDGAPETGIRTTGGGSAITVESGTRVALATTLEAEGVGSSTHTEIFAESANVTVRAHGTPSDSARGVDASRSLIGSGSGRLLIESADSVFLENCDLDASLGGVDVRAFDDFLSMDATRLDSEVGNVRIESGGGVTIENSSRLESLAADLQVHAFGGDLVVRDGSQLRATDGLSIGVSPAGSGQVDVSASANVTFETDGSIDTSGSGGINVHAHGGSVFLEQFNNFDAAHFEDTKTGSIRVEASESVQQGGQSFISAAAGMIEIRAHDGNVDIFGETFVRSESNDVDVRASDAITNSPPVVTEGPLPYFEGVDVLLRAGPGGIDLELDYIAANDGRARLLAEGDVRLRTGVSAVDELTVQSLDGNVDANGASFDTSSNGSDSGDITIESFGGSDAVIDLTDASVETAEAEGTSGSIAIIIHALGVDAIDAFVLPKAVKLKINKKKSSKSKLRISGFFDTGVAPVNFEGPAIITVGERDFEQDLLPRSRGRAFGVKTDEFIFLLRPSRVGTSKSKFTMRLRGDIEGIVPTDGPVTLRFRTGDVDGMGTVITEKGRYKLGKRRGTLVAPSLFPFNLRAGHKNPGKAKLQFKAGLSTQGGPPETIPDVTIRYGDILTFAIPGDQFVKKGDNFIAKRPANAPTVAKLAINFVRETVVLKAVGLDLGPLPEGPQEVTLSIQIGDETNAVTVRLAPDPKKKLNRY